VDEETDDGVLLGNGDLLAENVPPPPAKDGDTASISAATIWTLYRIERDII